MPPGKGPILPAAQSLLEQKALPNDEVHIWQIDLDLEDHDVVSHSQALSPAERKRAQRFHFEHHRRRYLVSHGALRHILSAYLGTSPTSLTFDLSTHGKPSLGDLYQSCGIHFNLTHSHEIALLVLGSGVEVGVDVEYVREMGDIDGIAARFFSEAEQKDYLDLDQSLKPQGFFNCWTRKEAFIKAIGEGLSYPLNKFDVSLVPGEPVQLLRVARDPSEARRWTLYAFHPTPDYTAAVAIRASGVQFIHFSYQI